MTVPTKPSRPTSAPPRLFATTRWSVVMTARDPASPESQAALETLCRAYWQPLYAFVRRLGKTPHDAQDLTQEFFSRLLEKHWLNGVVRERGRFRSFLIMAVKRFLANEWSKARTLKRGGGVALVALDTDRAEERYLADPTPALPADHLYERRWALTLLDRVMVRLRAEYEGTGRTADFERLKEFLTAERGAIPYAAIAAGLGTSEGAARVAVHRLRKRFREVFRETVADTVSNPAEVEEELRYLVEVLGRV